MLTEKRFLEDDTHLVIAVAIHLTEHCLKSSWSVLTYFMPLASLCIPRKHHKTSNLAVFLEGIKIQWYEMSKGKQDLHQMYGIKPFR